MKTLRFFARGASLVALLACTCALAADPGDPERLAEARALLRAIQIEQQFDAMVGPMGQAMARQFAQGNPGRNPRVMEVFMEEAMSGMKAQATRPGGFFDALAQAYASQFTLGELRQIREFYLSPVGQRMLRATPAIMQQLMPQMMQASQELAPRLCARAKARLIAEKVAEGESMQCPPAAP